ncbi:hypothetical protein JCM19037_3224 [Geomicrobium sp. JCM 19037]|uniref:DUF2508 family protein n=1 Tax=unclassified Geomicrobium TaxID=2628951 RepID=UPI00045F3505|nr:MULTISPECIES: DUF2508 family protein [unclassified Geomicrobium]GAK04777.1 hypothetical protein JCM19037_3224 [Geomicrobium sp. JCM 19037]GAK11947.1 hypothetical protein JCM19039_1672 [Geomicrobium sp. JCM 19039]
MRRKAKIYHKEKKRLYEVLDAQKFKLSSQKKHMEKSIDPSREALAQLKMEEAKYRFLLKEARRW